MPNPVPTPCTANAWTKVADDVLNCTIHKFTKTPTYYHTYRVAGEAAPTATPPVSADSIEWKSDTLIVNFSYPVDIYLYSAGAAGAVRVDQ